MTSAPLICLIEGRDYYWRPSSCDDIHSVCLVKSGDDERQVAALRPHPERNGWLLVWHTTTPLLDSAWAPQHCSYILDARDFVARQLPHFLVEHPNPTPATQQTDHA